MGSVRVINFSKTSKTFEPSPEKNWVLNGKKNEGYKYVIDCYRNSPTNSAIIDSYAKFIYGRGLTAKYSALNASQWASIQSILPQEEVKKVCLDYSLFYEFSIEIILAKNGKEIAQINHLPNEKVLPSKVNEQGVIASYWYSFDWSQVNKYPPVEIPAFNLESKEKRMVLKFKKYSYSNFYFSEPSYYAGLNYAELESEISKYCINHIQNGLSAGYVINVNEAITEDEVKDAFERTVINKWTGAENANRFILSFNSSKDNATTIESVEVSNAHEQYQFLTEEARKQLMVAHKVVSPMIFGIKDGSGLGNNANEIETAFNETMMNVIKPMQDDITQTFEMVFKYNDYNVQLDFESLRIKEGTADSASQSYNGAQISSAVEIIAGVKQGILTQEQAIVFLIQFLNIPKEVAQSMFTTASAPLTQLCAHDTVADQLINLGEDEDLENYDLVAECEVDYEVDVNLASTGTARPNEKSKQDSADYLVRYQYAPLKVSENSREFCRKMVNAKKIYRKEDIIAMEKQAVNKGWGPNGADTYSIWLYKGGGDCHHKWFRKIYVKKGVEVDVNSPLADLISTTNARKNGFNPPANDNLVSIAPKDMDNNGFLKPR